MVFFVVEQKDGVNHKPLLPVMVYVHGGGYYQNSAVEHCPNYLLDHDIILVTLQYRLGPLGTWQYSVLVISYPILAFYTSFVL